MKTILGVEISNWGPSGVRNVLVDVFENLSGSFLKVFFYFYIYILGFPTGSSVAPTGLFLFGLTTW